jgi:hypothetical protein
LRRSRSVRAALPYLRNLKIPIGKESKVELPKVIRRGRLGGLLFETDKTFLLPSAMTGMRNLRRLYEQHGHLAVLVTGQTDRVGGADYNLGLSVERAESVAAFLSDQADVWMGWYDGRPHSQRWGPPEDDHMLRALGHASLADFQAAKGLPGAGSPDRATRRALVVDYMRKTAPRSARAPRSLTSRTGSRSSPNRRTDAYQQRTSAITR